MNYETYKSEMKVALEKMAEFKNKAVFATVDAYESDAISRPEAIEVRKELQEITARLNNLLSMFV